MSRSSARPTSEARAQALEETQYKAMKKDNEETAEASSQQADQDEEDARRKSTEAAKQTDQDPR